MLPILPALKTVKEFIFIEIKPDIMFGVGNPPEESKLDEIVVFLYCALRTGRGAERRRISLPSTTPVKSVLERVGGEFDQDLILDENQFQIVETHRPISHFSCKGKLNLLFVYSKGLASHLHDTVTSNVATAISGTVCTINEGVNTIGEQINSIGESVNNFGETAQAFVRVGIDSLQSKL